MPAKVIRESLAGGIVQTRHPTLLEPGELQAAADCILRPGDPALHKAPGRTLYGAVRTYSVSTTTNSNTTLASAALFGLDFTNMIREAGNPMVTKAAGFGVLGSDFQLGQEVAASGIPAGAYIKRYFLGGSSGTTPTLELSAAPTTTVTGTGTIITSDLHVGMWISGSGIPVLTQIVSFTSASALTMSNPATNSAGPVARTISNQVEGLRFLSFDHGFSDLLLAKASDKVYTSPVTGITGTFTELAHGLSQSAESMLETVQYKNRHIYLTGFDPPRVLYWKDSGSGKTVQERALGMLPVADFVGAAIKEGGSWSSLTDLQNGWYYFIVTEVAIFGNDEESEGTYTGDPKGVHITAYATQGVTVTYTNTASTPVNDGNYGRNTATHWRVYMAKSSEEFPIPDLSTFHRVAEVPISSASIDLVDANPFLSGYSKCNLTIPLADGALLPLFPGGALNALSQVAAQTKTCSVSAGSNVLTSAAFGTVSSGMHINDAAGTFPYGTTVIAVLPGATSLITSRPATLSASSTAFYFGNKYTFEAAYAVCPVNADGGGNNRRGGIFYNFGLPNTIGAFSTATITGIQVEIHGKFLSTASDAGFQVDVTRDMSSFPGVSKVAKFKSAASVVSLGGQFDLWGVSSWVPTDFADDDAPPPTKFGVRLRKAYGADGEILNHQIDGVRVTVYAGGNTINLEGEPFRTVIISDQLGNSFGTGANGPPPTASTGDVFEGMLLLNDISDESVLCGSLPDEEQAFPDVYRIPIESKDNDKIRVIRKVNNIVVVGCLNSVKRLNYFPRETDPDFTRGRCYEDIAGDHGMVGPRCAKLIDLPGVGAVLAYLSHNGLHFTDGVQSKFLNSDIDWTTLFANAYIQRSVLEVYPKLSLLALYYVPLGQTRKIRVLYFSYHPMHIKPNFQLPGVGPVTCENAAAASAFLSGSSYLLTGHSQDGNVYVEDSGTSDASGGVIEPNIITRRFAAQPGRTMRTERIFLLTDANGDATSGGFTATLFRQNEGEAVTQMQTEVNKNTLIGGLQTLWMNNTAETFEVRISKSESGGQNAAMRLHYLGLQLTEDSMQTNN